MKGSLIAKIVAVGGALAAGIGLAVSKNFKEKEAAEEAKLLEENTSETTETEETSETTTTEETAE